MSNRRDQLTDDAITQFLRSRSADPELGLLDDIVQTVGATPQDRPWLELPGVRLPRRAVLIVAIALLLATMGAIGVGSLLLRPDLTVTPLPATAGDWERVQVELPSGHVGNVVSLAASPRGLLAVVGEGVPDGSEYLDEARLAVSTDGQNWTFVSDDQHPQLSTPRSFGYPSVLGTDRGFLMLQLQEVWTSEDGYDWQRLASPVTDAGLETMRAATAGGPGLVAVGGDKAWYSNDGSDWSVAAVPALPEEILARPDSERYVEMTGVTAVGNDLVAWGIAEVPLADNGDEHLVVPLLWASSDGRTWVSVADSEMVSVAAVTGGPGGFVAAGQADSRAAVWFSADGQAWARVAEEMPANMMLNAAAGTSNAHVVVGADGVCPDPESCPDQEAVIWTSADGRSWSRVPSDDRFTAASAETVVAWGSRFVVGGAQRRQPVMWISGSEQPESGGNARAAPAEAISTPAPGEPVQLAGTWQAADLPPDSGHQTMAIVELQGGTYQVTIRDDVASVCGGIPSTMTGVAEPAAAGTLVIEQPELACDDGSPAKAVTGPPLEEQLGGLELIYDSPRDALHDSFGLEWTRVPVAPR